MPASEWEDWRQVTETFLAERPVTKPDDAVDVLLVCIDGPLGELVAGHGLCLVSTKIFLADIPGYGARRALALFDRFVDWLRERGVITTWQRDVLWSKSDESREACGGRPLRDGGVRELELQCFGSKLVERFAETLETERDRALARAVVADLESTIAAQIGSRGSAPAGMLDVDRLLRAWVAFEAEKGDRGLCVEAFAMLSRFYRWLGETEQLEPDRARLLASQLSAAALGVAA
ncbi:MAG: hypothetical protein SangKO_017450 [Sandaracinaceae bacterium]